MVSWSNQDRSPLPFRAPGQIQPGKSNSKRLAIILAKFKILRSSLNKYKTSKTVENPTASSNRTLHIHNGSTSVPFLTIFFPARSRRLARRAAPPAGTAVRLEEDGGSRWVTDHELELNYARYFKLDLSPRTVRTDRFELEPNQFYSYQT